ncbi:MAG: hypothetical protein FJ137_14440 [Deltaproteobacteria bacterium]|nr:hypothetical protein [Deltaproteobacteria bacterium]
MPPPPRPQAGPGAADRGDERPRAPVAEAERLAREHSNKREQKARQERAQPDSRGSPPTRPERPSVAPGTPVARPLTPAPSSRPRVAPDRSATAVERPDDRPRPTTSPPAVRDVPLPRAQPSFEPPPSAGAALIDDVAVEAEELLREGAGVWGRFTVADRITVVAALLTLFGTLLPWLWRKNADVVLGIGSGGIVHAFVAGAALTLLVRRESVTVDDRGVRLTRDRQRQRQRRTALWLLLLSLVSTVSGTWLLLVWGAVRRFEVPDLEIGAGLYLTLAAGLGLSYSGFATFWRR